MTALALLNYYSYFQKKLSPARMVQMPMQIPWDHSDFQRYKQKEPFFGLQASDNDKFFLHNLVNYLALDYKYFSFHQWASQLNRALVGQSLLNNISVGDNYHQRFLSNYKDLILSDFAFTEQIFQYRTQFSTKVDSMFSSFLHEFGLNTTFGGPFKLEKHTFYFANLTFIQFLQELNFEFYFIFSLFKEGLITETAISSWLFTVNSFLFLKYNCSLVTINPFLSQFPALKICAHLFSLLNLSYFGHEFNFNPQILNSFSQLPSFFNQKDFYFLNPEVKMERPIRAAKQAKKKLMIE